MQPVKEGMVLSANFSRHAGYKLRVDAGEVLPGVGPNLAWQLGGLGNNRPAFEALRRAAAACTSRPVVITDSRQTDNPIAFANAAFECLTGYPKGELVGQNCRMLQGAGTDSTTRDEIRRALLAGQPIRRDILNYRKNGEAFWNDVSIDPIRESGGSIIGYVSVQLDVTETRRMKATADEAEQRLAMIISNVPGYVFQRRLRTDGVLSYSYISPSFFRLLGIADKTDLSNGQFLEYLHAADRTLFVEAARVSSKTLEPMHVEFRLVSPTGVTRWFRSDSSVRRSLAGDVVWEGLALDITDEKAAAAEIAYLSQHDALTGLSNRQQFMSSIGAAIAHIDSGSTQVAMFSLDLDGFQTINAALGQSFGDKFLRQIGLRVQEATRPYHGVVARLGGDEFAVMLPALSLETSLTDIAEDLRFEVLRPMVIDGTEAAADTCIGFATATDPFATLGTELMDRSQIALLSAKQSGVGVCMAYSPALDDRVQHASVLRHSIAAAVTEQQFVLDYQPIVDLASGRIVAAEALVRWDHPTLGRQRPDLFIPIAEATGLIVPLGEWVLRAVISQTKTWASNGIAPPRIAFNVSALQLQRPGFVEAVARAMIDFGVDASGFDVELTEGTVIEASPEVSGRLSALKALGLGLVIDDFGTGHSGLRYLRDLPFSKLKIDQTFVRNLVVDSSDALIVRAVMSLARSLNLEVVAEGIETAAQRDFLQAEGCTTGQGYLFSKPLTTPDFERALRRGWLCPVRAPSVPPGQ